MERRFGLRGQVDLPAIQYLDGFTHDCRVIDISARGLVVHRSRVLAERPSRLMYQLELALDEAAPRVRAWARPVWTHGSLQAMRYVVVDEMDRLEIAELLDRIGRKGALLH